jgi:beta-glucosidase
MNHTRFISSFVFASVGLWALAVTGCASPSRSTSGAGASTGQASGGSGNSTSSGVGGSGGPGATGGPGAGGSGDIILTGSGGTGAGPGSGGSTGAGGAGPTGGGGSAPTGAAGSGVVKMACPGGAAEPFSYAAGYTPDPTIHASAMTLAASLSDADKQQQMSGLSQIGALQGNFNVFRQDDNTARGIKAFFFRDGPRGLNLNANADNKSDYSTAFPVAIARGAAFDEDLEFKVGEAIGDEMLASGNTMLLAPTVNILRHPAWGRAQETYGEDVFLLGRLGSSFVSGVQQYGAACAKHYAANNIEDGRETANATMDEQTLREIYARHFEMIIQEGGVSSIMAAYNEVNGTHSTQSTHLLTDLLRTDFGFLGFVLSDWWAMPNGNMVPYPSASTLQPVAQQAVNAGLDMELPWRYNYSTLTNLTSAGGGLTSAQLTTSAARIIEQKMRFKVDKLTGAVGLKTPFSTYDSSSSIANNNQVDPVLGVSHIDLAEQAAEESMVLLKNSNATLPINRSNVHKIAVIGASVSYSLQSTNSQDSCTSGQNGIKTCTLDFTTNVRTGDDGSSRVFSDPAKSTSPLAGVQADATGITVTNYNTAAAAQAAGFDFAVVIAGLTPGDEGEEYTGAGDRTTGGINSMNHAVNLGLDPKVASGQNALITSVAAIGKPMVVVLEGGSVIDVSPWIANVPAVVMAWYPGMAGGKALGRLLFGDANFSGKLPLTWDANVAHWPTFASSTGTTQMDYYSGYRYFDHQGTALQPTTGSFPFGYGLSYSTFQYTNLQVPCSTVPSTGVVNVTVDVSNTSAVAGSETVFLFVQYPSSKDTKRAAATYKELKGFHRVALTAMGTAGAAKRITIPLRVKDLKYWNGTQWAVETGTLKVIVAPNATAASAAACAGGTGVGCGLSDTFTVTQ